MSNEKWLIQSEARFCEALLIMKYEKIDGKRQSKKEKSNKIWLEWKLQGLVVIDKALEKILKQKIQVEIVERMDQRN